MKLQKLGVFAAIGGGVMIFGALLLFALVHLLDIDQNIAYTIQTFISIETNFRLNAATTWKDRPGDTWGKWKRFYYSKIFTIVINQILFAILTQIGVY